jgi:CheY-like chemotaxis protein
MTTYEESPQTPTPPETFVKQVKEVLENLYDFPFLQRHPLARTGQSTADASVEAAARRLRRELIAAIEALNPGTEVSSHTPQARIYNLLILHYVEGRTVQEAAHEIGLSERQAHRNLRQGEESVAQVLWSRRPPVSPEEPRATHLSSVQEEMARLVTQPRPVELLTLLARAQAAVKQQAEQRQVALTIEPIQKSIIISTDPALAQQVLINALSHTIRQAQPGRLRLTPAVAAKQINVTWQYEPTAEARHTPAIGEVVTQLADRLGWTIRQANQPHHTRSITVRMSAPCPTVLVIDDNEGLVKLLDDYLTGHACQVIAATDGPEGLRLAQELVPEAVVLDVMIPGMDGWEVLQRLRHHPQTADIPVIMCSVLDSPELAQSLGASLFLSKPVSRDEVLTALHRLEVV